MQVRDVVLTQEEHRELGKRVSSRRGRADDARIARVSLLLADGASYTQVQQKVGCTAPYISKWKRRFLEERLAGLYARHEGRPVQVLTPRMEARILSWTQKKPDRRLDSLEHASTCEEAGNPSHDGGSHLEKAWSPATPN